MKEDITAMAREAGVFNWSVGQKLQSYVGHDGWLERLVQLVAKRCAEIADTAEPYKSADLIKKHFGVDA